MATISAIIEQQFNAFVKSSKSKQPHVPILVKAFEREAKEVSFTYDGNKIKIPNSSILSPSTKKKKLTTKDFVDVESKSVLLILKATILPNWTNLLGTTDCNPTVTCRVLTKSVIIPTPNNLKVQEIREIERLEGLIHSLHIYV